MKQWTDPVYRSQFGGATGMISVRYNWIFLSGNLPRVEILQLNTSSVNAVMVGDTNFNTTLQITRLGSP